VKIFRGITHSLLAISLYLILGNTLYFNITFIWIIACLVFGSLLPDIDHPYSTLGKYIFPISGAIKHRGFTHSFLAAFILPLPLLYFGTGYYFITIWSYLLHLLVDTLSPMGVMWLYPIKKRYSLNLAKTGGIEEAFIVVTCLLFIFKIKIF